MQTKVVSTWETRHVQQTTFLNVKKLNQIGFIRVSSIALDLKYRLCFTNVNEDWIRVTLRRPYRKTKQRPQKWRQVVYNHFATENLQFTPERRVLSTLLCELFLYHRRRCFNSDVRVQHDVWNSTPPSGGVISHVVESIPFWELQ